MSWTPAEVAAGQMELTRESGAPVTITWGQAAEDPGWCKLDWIVADPVRRRVANASNMLDVTWEAPDGSIAALDGFIDPYYQEIYLEPESMPVFAKIAKQLTGASLERYVDELEHEVRKYAGSDANYGKAARRMYNVFRLTGRFQEAAYIRELFDEPAALLYQVWSLVRSLEEASQPGSQIDGGTLVGQVDELIMESVRALEGEAETEMVTILLRLRDNLLRRSAGDESVVEADVVAARAASLKAVNEYFYARLMALPAIATTSRASPPPPDRRLRPAPPMSTAVRVPEAGNRRPVGRRMRGTAVSRASASGHAPRVRCPARVPPAGPRRGVGARR